MDANKNLALKSNPDTGTPAVARQTKPQITPKTHISGDTLVPSQASMKDQGTLTEYRYWVGVSPSCPVEHIDLAGINFPKINENIVPDPLRTGLKKRIPVIGSIVFLTEDKIRMMRDKLPRTVIRFLDDKGVQEERGTGQNIGDNHVRPRRGQIITIPTAAEVKAKKKAGKPTGAYTPHKNDVPAARFMFAQICADQVRGSRGESYPEPLEVTGLDWVDDILDFEGQVNQLLE